MFEYIYDFPFLMHWIPLHGENSTRVPISFFGWSSSSKYVNASINLPIRAVEKAVGKYRHTQSGLLSETS